MIRPSSSSSPRSAARARHGVAGGGSCVRFDRRCGGSRWRAGTGGRPGRAGRRRTGRARRPAADHGLGALAEGPGQRRRAAARRASPRARAPRSPPRACLGLDDRRRPSNGKTSITTRSSSASHDSVIVPARNSSSIGCSSGPVSARSTGVHRRASASRSPLGAAMQLVEQLVDPLGQHRHLLLLQGHAGRRGCRSRACRKKVRWPGGADGARDEALGRVEAVHRPVAMPASLGGGPRRRRPTAGVARRRVAAPRRPLRSAPAACRWARSPAVVFMVTTNGRSGV